MPERDLVRALMTVAQSDVTAFEILVESQVGPLEVIGFHAQQAVEKYIKAVLLYRGCLPPRTHDLDRLVALLA